jgi:uncharacterized membrane protein YeaQ/YmgE (transglycosylase-associated protein family)
MEPETIRSIITWAVTGGIAGWLASLLLRTEKQGCLVNIILGIAGAFVGGFVVGYLIFPGGGGFTGWWLSDSICNATIGSILILLVLEIILPGRQIGVRRTEEKRARKGRGEGGGLADILDRFLH